MPEGKQYETRRKALDDLFTSGLKSSKLYLPGNTDAGMLLTADIIKPKQSAKQASDAFKNSIQPAFLL